MAILYADTIAYLNVQLTLSSAGVHVFWINSYEIVVATSAIDLEQQSRCEVGQTMAHQQYVYLLWKECL